MVNILIVLGLIILSIIVIAVFLFLALWTIKDVTDEKEPSDPCIRYICIPKIKNGSKLTIGKYCFTAAIKVNQHFNWFQKKMWKLLLGIKVEDYSEED